MVCTLYKLFDLFLTLASAVTRCISISVSAFMLSIPIGITSSAIALKTCSIAAGIKKYKSIIRERKRSMQNGINSKFSIK